MLEAEPFIEETEPFIEEVQTCGHKRSKYSVIAISLTRAVLMIRGAVLTSIIMSKRYHLAPSFAEKTIV